jgi:hypothetical protein
VGRIQPHDARAFVASYLASIVFDGYELIV